MMIEEVYKLAVSVNNKISKSYLKSTLETHPFFPSAIAIKDALANVGLEIAVVQINIEDISKLQASVLVHSEIPKGGSFKFYKNFDIELFRKYNPNTPNAIVIFIERNDIGFENEENEISLRKDQFENRVANAARFFVVIFATLMLSKSPNLFTSVIAILYSIGLYFSTLLIKKEFNVSSTFGDKVCAFVNQQGCDKVLRSDSSRLFSWLTLSDIGVVYFSSALLYTLLASVSSVVTLRSLSLISLAAGLFPFYSIFYQVRIVKQLCGLCIAVVGILFINALLSWIQLDFHSADSAFPKFFDCALLIALFLGMTSLWLVIKKFIEGYSVGKVYQRLFRKFRKNPDIFLSMLKNQNLGNQRRDFDEELFILGNKEAILQLHIVCSPYCNPCASAFKELLKLNKRFGDRIKITFRFLLNEWNLKNEDETLSVIKHITAFLIENPNKSSEILEFWYRNSSFEKLAIEYPINKKTEDFAGLMLKEFLEKSRLEKISGTPTFWVNGQQLPSFYNWLDLFDQLPILIEEEML
jgi:uncharacterized membrane protein